MTLLVSWAGVDTHGTTSAYIAADSRVSWGDVANFDHGRKVFAFRRSPDILGYCGDVLFPTMVLSQITEMADRGLLFSPNATCKERFEAIKEKLIQQFQCYPRMIGRNYRGHVTGRTHLQRPDQEHGFLLLAYEWDRNSGWSGQSMPMPSKSGILFCLGSGSSEFSKNLDRYAKGPDRGTSRSVFHCFCDTLFNIEDKQCGGAPNWLESTENPGPRLSHSV